MENLTDYLAFLHTSQWGAPTIIAVRVTAIAIVAWIAAALLLDRALDLVVGLGRGLVGGARQRVGALHHRLEGGGIQGDHFMHVLGAGQRLGVPVYELLGLDPHRLAVPGRKRLAIELGRPIREIMA